MNEKLICEIRVPREVDANIVTNPFRILGYNVRKIGDVTEGYSIYEVTAKPVMRKVE